MTMLPMYIVICIAIWVLGIAFFLRVLQVMARQGEEFDRMMDKKADDCKSLRKQQILKRIKLRREAIERKDFDAVAEHERRIRVLVHGI